ncbi:MAG: histidine kinase N-terminal 7TM domain-containing protein [Candidatus Aminicenantales bacterium]
MIFQFAPWAIVLVLGAVVSIVLAIASWPRRRSPGGGMFFLLMIALAWWQIFAALEMFAVPPGLKLLFIQIMYFGVTSVAPLFFLFCFDYNEIQIRSERLFRYLLWVIPALVTVLAFTNPSHRLIWSSVTSVPGSAPAIQIYPPGPALFFFAGYCYALLFAATVFLVNVFIRVQKPLKRKAVWIIVGTVFPWLGNLMYFLNLGPAGIDPTPFFFVLSGIFLSLSLTGRRLLVVTPIAYGSIFDYMTDSVIVFDEQYRVIDANPAAGRVFNVSKKNVGETLEKILAPWPDFSNRVASLQSTVGARALKIPRDSEWLETRFFNLYDRMGAVRGHFMIVQDVTESKKAEEERAASMERIQEQRKLLHQMSLSPASAEGDFPKAAREITEMMGKGLGAERTSVWLGSAKESLIRCLDLYKQSSHHHSPGPVLMADRYPRYFEALSRDRAIDASDAMADPRTREFKDSYLQPLGITSMLDAPIRVAGAVIGVVCNEHIGPPRRWKDDEIRFAAEAADATAQAYANWEKRKIEDARRESEERFRMLVEAAPDAIIVQAEGVFTYLNAAALRLYGISSAEQLLGRPVLDSIHPDDQEKIRGKIRILNEEKRSVSYGEERILQFDGTPVETESSAVPIRYRDLDGALVFIRNITERKRAESAIAASYQEKVVLLREIQNRVRNNMQIVLSLLNHQAGAVADPVLRRAFTASRDRIKAISLVQDKLYKSEDLSRIDFADYVQNLTVHLFHTYQVDSEQIRCAFDLCPTVFNVNLSIPLGIIVNEIVLNAIHYAFPGKKRGEISLRLSKNEKGIYTLQVRDNGVGIPGQVNPAKASTLGFQLIGMLVEQINGEVKVETTRGTSFTIIFPDWPKTEE